MERNVKKTGQSPSRTRGQGVISQDLIDSKRLLYFFHVARMRSFSAAEAILGVAQPALSRQIQQLESELGVQLLVRNGRGVSLTQYGTILQEQAVTILGDMSNAVEQLELARRNPAGQISIAASAGIMAYFMPEILRRYVAAFPEIRVTALQAATGEVYDHLAAGTVDVAIILQARSAQKLTCQRLMVEPLYLVARRDHQISGQQFVERSQLPNLPLVLPASRHGMRDYIDEYCKEGGIEINCNLFIDSVPLMKALVLDTGVCCFLPKLICEKDLDPAKFVFRPLKPALSRSLYVASLQSQAKSPYVKALIREVITVFKEKGERLNEAA
jgi:LysR family nitrogen assimilation transcriptional regulator